MFELREHQKSALARLGNGKILYGDTGSGKSLVGLAYYFIQCGGKIYDDHLEEMKLDKIMDLYIITPAQKRDKKEWETKELIRFYLSPDQNEIEGAPYHNKIVIDSWNNIAKYKDIENAFFIFDEQKVTGKGKWVQSFLKIAKHNQWILLSATPGDTWSAYIPVFIANGFYNNRTEFCREHIIYNRFITNFPKIDHYVGTDKLQYYCDQILVNMYYKVPVSINEQVINCDYDVELYNKVRKERINPFTKEPIKEISEYCSVLRRITFSDKTRLQHIKELYELHKKIIVYYNFDYERELLLSLKSKNIIISEWSGHHHQPLPQSDSWIYIIQYMAGNDAWNCTDTNVMVFYSLNYAWWVMHQSMGRIKRLDTPFKILFYYTLVSDSSIDKGIRLTLKNKEDFNEEKWVKNEEKLMSQELQRL